MGRTKVLEFNVGDLVLHKPSNEVMLIIDKRPHYNKLTLYKFQYRACFLTDGSPYGIYVDINNKHYKVLA